MSKNFDGNCLKIHRLFHLYPYIWFINKTFLASHLEYIIKYCTLYYPVFKSWYWPDKEKNIDRCRKPLHQQGYFLSEYRFCFHHKRIFPMNLRHLCDWIFISIKGTNKMRKCHVKYFTKIIIIYVRFTISFRVVIKTHGTNFSNHCLFLWYI